MTHTPTPWHVDAYGCSKDYRLRLCEPMRSGFPLATIAQFEYNWRDAGQYDRQISYKEAEANARRAASSVNALEGFDIAAIEAGVVKELVEALEYARREIVNLAVSGTDRINEVCERLQKTDPSPIWPIPFPDPPERTWQPIVRRIDAALAKLGGAL